MIPRLMSIQLLEIPYQNPLQVFSLFAAMNGAVFLDSAQLRPHCGRYSFIAVDPFQILSSKNGVITLNEKKFSGDPFSVLESELAKFPLDFVAGLPPFQGGAAGFLSYELVQHLEKVPAAKKDDLQFPDLAIGFYDVVLGFDEQEKRAWIFSSGYPLQESQARLQRAQERLQWMLKQLKNISSLPIWPGCQENIIESNFSRAAYEDAAKKVVEYILAGDIFEANISQRFQAALPQSAEPFALYCKLRALNPAPFAAYLNLSETVLASASPERFLKLQKSLVETRPIKGTRPRGSHAQEDESYAQELLTSQKDHAENVMIVDLLRNDLSRVCENHSVQVPQLCGLESYATVHHLVSVVTGKLKPRLTAIDLLRAAFPGGSITGAPKIRAMEIIAEIEPTHRGPYCGSIGYIGFNGDMDVSIAIRTFGIKNNIVTFQAGGAVVADSHAAAEYEETLTKARALRKALIGD